MTSLQASQERKQFENFILAQNEKPLVSQTKFRNKCTFKNVPVKAFNNMILTSHNSEMMVVSKADNRAESNKSGACRAIMPTKLSLFGDKQDPMRQTITLGVSKLETKMPS